jgi:hypothetical protein
MHGEVGKRIEPPEISHDRRRLFVGRDGSERDLLLPLQVVVNLGVLIEARFAGDADLSRTAPWMDAGE